MHIQSISVSRVRRIEFGGRRTMTGICKHPVDGSVWVSQEGIDGDQQADRKNHGGIDKAVYVYAVENYLFWEESLGKILPYGQFGENLAVTGMTDDKVHIGDIFSFGSVEVQVTQPRVPCFKLGMRMEDDEFVGKFHFSGRVGFYLRVLKEGFLNQGDKIELIHADGGQLNIQEAMLALNKNPRQQEIIKRALAITALSQAWCDSLTKKQQ